MAMEGCLHQFGVKTEAREQELHQQLVESQAPHADPMKDVHELQQFTIVKLALCTPRLDSLDRDVHNHCTEVTQTLANLEAREKRVVVTEDVLVHIGLQELKTKLQGMKEDIGTIRGKWEEATLKLQEFDKEMETV